MEKIDLRKFNYLDTEQNEYIEGKDIIKFEVNSEGILDTIMYPVNIKGLPIDRITTERFISLEDTGMTDREGTPIFEGDFVQLDGYIYEIEKGYNGFEAVKLFSNGIRERWGCSIEDLTLRDFVKVGNATDAHIKHFGVHVMPTLRYSVDMSDGVYDVSKHLTGAYITCEIKREGSLLPPISKVFVPIPDEFYTLEEIADFAPIVRRWIIAELEDLKEVVVSKAKIITFGLNESIVSYVKGRSEVIKNIMGTGDLYKK